MYHIEAASPLDRGRIGLRFRDGFVGEVSILNLIETGGVFGFLSDPEQFRKLDVGEDGRWLYWTDPAGDQIDLCADALRYEAEERAVEQMAAAE